MTCARLISVKTQSCAQGYLHCFLLVLPTVNIYAGVWYMGGVHVAVQLSGRNYGFLFVSYISFCYKV